MLASLSRKWPLLLGVAFAVLLAWVPLYTDDAGFHVATGRWIRGTGQVPDFNPFSYANDGEVWVQHQWLPAVAMSWLADTYGPLGLVGWKIGWVAVAFALGAVGIGLTTLPVGLGAALLSLAAAATSFRFLERPFLTSIAALAVVSAAVMRFRQTGRLTPLLVAAVVPAVAVQLHAGGLDGLLVWAALLGGLAVEWLLDRDAERLARLGEAAVIALLLALLVMFGLKLLAPAGLQVLALPIRFSSNAYWHEHLAEFRRLKVDLPSMLPWVSIGVVLLSAVRAAKDRKVVELLILCGFAILANRHVRMVWPMWAACLPVIARVWQDWPGWTHTRWQGLAVAAVLPLCGFGLWDQHARFGLGLADRPGVHNGLAEARFALPMLQLGGRLSEGTGGGETLVSDGLAGTWLWQVWRPEHPKQHRVLVHNCLECYKESTYIDVYQKLRYGEPGWEAQLARYAIRSFVLKHTSPGERRYQGGKPNLRQHLFVSPKHVLVDFDDVASVYAEPATLPADVSPLGVFPIDPDSGKLREGAHMEEAVAALLQHAERHPHVVRSLWLAGRLLVQAGLLPQANDVARQLVQRAIDAPETENLLQLVARSAQPAQPGADALPSNAPSSPSAGESP